MPGAYGYPEFTESQQQSKGPVRKKRLSPTDLEAGRMQTEANLGAAGQGGELSGAMEGSRLGDTTKDFLMMLAAKGQISPEELFQILAAELGLPEAVNQGVSDMRVERMGRPQFSPPSAKEEELRKLQQALGSGGR